MQHIDFAVVSELEPSCAIASDPVAAPWVKAISSVMRSNNIELRVRAADDAQSLLVIVADVDACSWVRSTGSAEVGAQSLRKSVVGLITFVRAFELQHADNRAVVLVVSSGGHKLAYPRSDTETLSDRALRGGTSDANEDDEGSGEDVQHALPDAVRDCAAKSGADGNTAPRVAAALARALCMINRARSSATASPGAAPLQARVLMLLAGGDDPAQYVSVMNCFFSAQRMKVPIDACVVGGPSTSSTYFQQAAFLTKGVYFRPESLDTLVQTLLTVFLPDQLTREFLAMPAPGEVDFRASCFETRKVIDNGFTCSVCLSTFDVSVKKGAAMCPVCGARFAPPKPPSGRKRALSKK